MKKIASLLMLTLLVLTVVSTLAVRQVARASPTTTVFIDPMWSAATLSSTFTIKINVSNVADLHTWSVSLRWKTEYLYTQDGTPSSWIPDPAVTEGTFLYDYASLNGYSLFSLRNVYYSPFELWSWMDLGCMLLGDVPGASGSGTLVSITFRVDKAGGVSSPLDMYDVSLVRSPSGGGGSIPCELTVIDIFALVRVALKYGTVAPEVDVDGSGGNINISDLAHVAKNYKYEALVVGKS